MATLRRIISLFADALCNTLDVHSNAAPVQDEEKQKEVPPTEMHVLQLMSTKLEPFLLHSSGSGRERTLRMFLLKNLERRRGVSFLRSALQQRPFSDAKWLETWKATGEPGLIRFLGSNKLPQNNPFGSFPLMEPVHTAVSACLTPQSTSCAPLDDLMMALIADPMTQLTVKGSLLLALFQEVYLLQVLPEIPEVVRERFVAVQAWVQNSPSLAFLTPPERQLLRFFSGDSVECDHDVASFFGLNPASSPEHIAMVRVLVHIAATALSSPGNDYMAFFRSVIVTPDELKGSFFPCMPEDVTAMAVRVLGGRWFTCVNGHAYYVDACGLPTIIQKCATCGVDIGGNNHKPLPDQGELDKSLEGNREYSERTKIEGKSDPLYCFREAAQEADPFDVARDFTPLANRTVRFLLHGALLLSGLAHDTKWTSTIRGCLNPSYSNPPNVTASFLAHLAQDFNITKKIIRKSDDDTALMLHILLESSRTD
jgi:hypothetical protein